MESATALAERHSRSEVTWLNSSKRIIIMCGSVTLEVHLYTGKV